jgi:hypothetical protein
MEPCERGARRTVSVAGSLGRPSAEGIGNRHGRSTARARRGGAQAVVSPMGSLADNSMFVWLLTDGWC